MAYIVARQSFKHRRASSGGRLFALCIPSPNTHHMVDSTGFEKLASIHEIPEEGVLGVTASDGRRVCLIRSRGRITAVAGNCTHQDFEMSLGDVLPDGTIQCAWHGARFDCATGAVRQGPATQPLPLFEVRLEGDDVMVGPAAAEKTR